MKILIITGDQGSGKTLLAAQMRSFNKDIIVRDEFRAGDIHADPRENFHHYIYVTQDKVTYREFPRDMYTIIRLSDLNSMTSNVFITSLQEMKYMVQEEVLGTSTKQIYLEGNFFSDNLRFVMYKNGVRVNDCPKAHWKEAIKHFNAIKL